MKRQIKRIVLMLLLCLIVFLVVSCGIESTSSHTIHSYTTKSNSTKHWKECSCGKQVEAENHSFGDWITAKEATPTSTGTKERKCSVCGYKEEGTIPKSNHSHNYPTTYKSDSAKHWKECSCGQKKDEENHTFGDWITTKEATITSTGTKERKCSVCECKEEETIPKLDHNHNYSTTYKSDSTKHWKECACGERKDEEDHTFGSWNIIKENSFTQAGERRRVCDKCSYEEKETIPIKTEVKTIEELIKYFGDQVNENLRKHYDGVIKQVFKNAYDSKKDWVTNYKWDLGELVDGKVQDLKLMFEYSNNTDSSIKTYNVKLDTPLRLNDLLDLNKVSATTAKYTAEYTFNYNNAKQNDRNDLINAILKVAITDGFDYKSLDTKIIYKELHNTTDSKLGVVNDITVVVVSKTGIREISIKIKQAKTDKELIMNIYNNKYNVTLKDVVHFSNNQLKDVILKVAE